jgi:hypothetical protein
MSPNTYRRDLAGMARRYGATIERGRRHYRLHLPCGRFVTVPASASCPRALLNIEATIRRENRTWRV